MKIWPDDLTFLMNATLFMKMQFALMYIMCCAYANYIGGYAALIVMLVFIVQDNLFVNRQIRLAIEHQRFLRSLDNYGKF